MLGAGPLTQICTCHSYVLQCHAHLATWYAFLLPWNSATLSKSVLVSMRNYIRFCAGVVVPVECFCMFLGFQFIIFVALCAILFLAGCKNMSIACRDTKPSALTRTVVQMPWAFMLALAIMAVTSSVLPFFRPPSINTSFETLTVQDHPVNAGPLVDKFLLSGTTHCHFITWIALFLLPPGLSWCKFHGWCVGAIDTQEFFCWWYHVVHTRRLLRL